MFVQSDILNTSTSKLARFPILLYLLAHLSCKRCRKRHRQHDSRPVPRRVTQLGIHNAGRRAGQQQHRLGGGCCHLQQAKAHSNKHRKRGVSQMDASPVDTILSTPDNAASIKVKALRRSVCHRQPCDACSEQHQPRQCKQQHAWGLNSSKPTTDTGVC